MTATTKLIEVEPGGELDKLLAQAHDATLILVKGNERYRVMPEETEEPRYLTPVTEDIFANYDPEKMHGMLERLKREPILTPEEGEALKELIYRARKEGTRPADRP